MQAARRGEYDAAVSALRALLAASPSDTATAFDLAVVLEWAGRPREATDVFERTGVAEPPEYVLGAMLRAYRTERRWAEAGALAAQGARRFPANPQWPLAGWMVRGDEAVASGDTFAALRRVPARRRTRARRRGDRPGGERHPGAPGRAVRRRAAGTDA